MSKRFSWLRLKPGVVLGAIAVFFAIGGIGYAAATVGTSDIKNGAVTNKKIKKHTIRKNRLHFTVHNGATGATGPQGPAGPTGPSGPAGPAGAGVNYNVRLGPNSSISRTVGAFTLTSNSNGAPACAANTITSTADAHYRRGSDVGGLNPYTGTALNAGNSHSDTFVTGTFNSEELVAVTDNASSEMIGLALGCNNVASNPQTTGVLFGD